jgi:hypothetical protein
MPILPSPDRRAKINENQERRLGARRQWQESWRIWRLGEFVENQSDDKFRLFGRGIGFEGRKDQLT